MMNTTGMMQGQQLVRIQGQVTGQQVTLQPGQPVTIQGQQMRMQGKICFLKYFEASVYKTHQLHLSSKAVGCECECVFVP